MLSPKVSPIKKKAISYYLALKKVLFIVPYPIGEAPSQRFRFEQYFPILKKNQISFDVQSFWSEDAWQILYKENYKTKKAIEFTRGFIKRFQLLFKIHQYNLVFIHREALPVGPPIFEYLISKVFKKQIIYDFDDAIWMTNTSGQNSIVSWIKFHNKVKNICKWSWKVSCGNGFLAEFARKFNNQVIINPTTIDTSYHRSNIGKSENQKKVIGWTGTHSTNKYFESFGLVLKELASNYNVEILAISDQKPNIDINNFTYLKWSKENEIQQLDHIDIGIMPLENAIWEKGKCGFKALQYMALEIPAVVSKVGANIDIIDHGINGFLCENSNDFKKHILDLISSQSLRTKIGNNARKKVVEEYSIQSNTEVFLSLFE